MKTKLLKQVRRTYSIYKVENPRPKRLYKWQNYLVTKKGFWEGFEEYTESLNTAYELIIKDVRQYYKAHIQKEPKLKKIRF